MKRKILILNLIILGCTSAIVAQKTFLQSGPMVGYAEMREVMLWVQTNKPATVKIKYWEKDKPENDFWTPTVTTKKINGFTAKLLADSVLPGKNYVYALFINNKKIDLPYATHFQSLTHWQYRTDPPEFTFAAGSGAYINEKRFDRPGKPYGGNYKIYESIANAQPDFMIWLGDNVYLREPDWNTWTGILHRYTHTRSTPQMQALLGSVHHYAILDDHDFGPNDCDGSFWNKTQTLNAFELFWANPSVGLPGIKGAITFFSWGDVDFFLLDNRYHRSPNKRKTGKKTILGEKQLEWLKNALTYSKASFKIVVMGGQFLNPTDKWETYANYGFMHERNELIDFIHQEELKGVIFLTGDRHHSELSILNKATAPTIYDITVSPLTSSPSRGAQDEPNYLRVPGSFFNQPNYGLFSVSGKFRERVVNIRLIDENGKQLWQYTIRQNDF